MNLKKEDFSEKNSDEFIEVNIEHINGRMTFQVKMENGSLVDVIFPKGEILQVSRSLNVDEGQVFAKIVYSAKRKLMYTSMKRPLKV